MGIALFDEIRTYYGSDRLKTIFVDMLNNNTEEAVKSLNNKNLRFPSLFILQQEINSSDIKNQLNTRNKFALEVINQLSVEETRDSESLLSDYSEEKYSTFRWILETGYLQDGMDDEYDAVLDTAGIVLVKVYNDRSCLKTMEKLIFNRYRKGAYIYDLVWAFFETINPQNINMIANRLRSSNPKDVELARNFLNFVPAINSNRDDEPQKQYQSVLKWINRNQSFIYYTGATNNQTPDPSRYAVSLEARYLQKPVASVIGDQSRSLGKGEISSLEGFNNLDDNSRVLLSDYSDMLFRTNRYRWSKWLQSPVEKQLEIARKVMGESND